jgi:hypothetical protein
MQLADIKRHETYSVYVSSGDATFTAVGQIAWWHVDDNHDVSLEVVSGKAGSLTIKFAPDSAVWSISVVA